MKKEGAEVTCRALFPRQPHSSIVYPNVWVFSVRKGQINPRIKLGHSFHLQLWIWLEWSALPFCVVNWLHRKCSSVPRLLGRINSMYPCLGKWPVMRKSESVHDWALAAVALPLSPIHYVTLCCIIHSLLMGLNKNPSIENQTRFILSRRNTLLFKAFKKMNFVVNKKLVDLE